MNKKYGYQRGQTTKRNPLKEKKHHYKKGRIFIFFSRTVKSFRMISSQYHKISLDT